MTKKATEATTDTEAATEAANPYGWTDGKALMRHQLPGVPATLYITHAPIELDPTGEVPFFAGGPEQNSHLRGLLIERFKFPPSSEHAVHNGKPKFVLVTDKGKVVDPVEAGALTPNDAFAAGY